MCPAKDERVVSPEASPKSFLPDLPVTSIAFHQVIPGVKVPVQRKLEYAEQLEVAKEAFSCVFRNICADQLTSAWFLPRMFCSVDRTSRHQDSLFKSREVEVHFFHQTTREAKWLTKIESLLKTWRNSQGRLRPGAYS